MHSSFCTHEGNGMCRASFLSQELPRSNEWKLSVCSLLESEGLCCALGRTLATKERKPCGKDPISQESLGKCLKVWETRKYPSRMWGCCGQQRRGGAPFWKTAVSRFGKHELHEEENTRVLCLALAPGGRMVLCVVSPHCCFGSLKPMYKAERKSCDW